MPTMNVSLPEKMKEYVEEQSREEGYSTTSEYIRALIREDRKRRAQEKLEELLLEGLDSGEPEPWTEEDWKEIRMEVQERLRAQKKNEDRSRS